MVGRLEERIRRRWMIGLGIGASVLLYNMVDWKREYVCRNAEKRVANPEKCYSGISPQFKSTLMHEDSMLFFGAKKK